MNKMSEAYKTVYVGDTAEIVEKKSRFIANLEHVESEEEALAYIETIRKNIGMQDIIAMHTASEKTGAKALTVMTVNLHRQQEANA